MFLAGQFSVYDEASLKFEVASTRQNDHFMHEDEVGEHLTVEFMVRGEEVRSDLTRIRGLGDIAIDYQNQVLKVNEKGESEKVVYSEQYYVRRESGLLVPRLSKHRSALGEPKTHVGRQERWHLAHVLHFSTLVARQPIDLLQL